MEPELRSGSIALQRAAKQGPRLADWVDLIARQRADDGLSGTELRRRDHALAAALPERPAARLTAWVRATRDDPRSPGQRSGEALRLAIGGLVALAFVFGIVSAAAALAYQPRGRINVVAVIGVLVALPALTLPFAIAGALPDALRRRLPGLRDDGEGLLQPARWALRLLPQATREVLEEALGRGSAAATLSAPIRRWLLVAASQGAAVGFYLGALAAALAHVVFTDLSFGWSTTLEVDASGVHALAHAIATPWRAFWPDASPTLSLVEGTRFYRIAPTPDAGLGVYGRWWPFVVATLACYGLLPRSAFLLFARNRYGSALARAVVQAPGSRRVLDRLASPLVETTSVDGEPAESHPEASPDSIADADVPSRAVHVSWGDALALAPRAPSAPKAEARHVVGGSQTPEDDTRTLEAAAAEALTEDLPVVLAVRAYEPPLAEQIDFVTALRERIGDAREIVVAGIGGDEMRLGAWRRRLASLGDPWLSLAAVSNDANDANDEEQA